MPPVACLGYPECGLCRARQADGIRSGWIPHVSGPDQAARIIGTAPPGA